ncbi:histidine ammonia-lyase [Alicycliphilus sp. B1]|nr:histidine ammonia-lyase [Alicycliphilus sp. B1]
MAQELAAGSRRSSPAIRARVAFLERDRYLAPDIEAMRLWALRTCWPETLRRILPSLAN